jgi:hypothetical protein
VNAQPPSAKTFIVRYAGAAVQFVQNIRGRIYNMVEEEDATKFQSEAAALQAIGQWHLSGRAYVEEIKP